MEIYKIDLEDTSVSSSSADGCRFDIRHGDTTTPSQITTEIMQELETIRPLIRWYMEVFAIDEPFQTSEAERASKKLCKYASWLLEALMLNVVLPKQAAPYHLLVQIRESTGLPTPFSSLHWEVLQNTDFLPKDTAFLSTSVVRLVSQTYATGFSDKVAAKFNILAVTARPHGKSDIPHRLITKSIYRVVQSVNAMEGRDRTKINLRISRPGSFKALQHELALEAWGTYGLVHLDLHGIVDKERAFALFDDARGRGADPVLAKDLAEELVKHGVKTVVLNACQSAVEGQALEANLAKTLVHHGIQTAVAMAYNLLDYTAKVFVSIFYEQLFSRGLPPLLAMQAARQQLIRDRRRVTKYGTEVTVDDYLVPVIYQHESPDITPDHIEILQQELRVPTLEDMGMDSEDELTGRECDLLDLERKLLMQSCIVSIDGPPGIGKSALAESAGAWWKATLLIDKYIRVKVFSLHYDSLLDILCKKLGVKAKGKESTPSSSGQLALIKKRLGKEKLVIHFDGVESTGPDKISGDNLTALSLFLGVFQKIQNTSQSKSFVLITARKLPRDDVLHQTIHSLQPLTWPVALEYSTSFLKRSSKMVESTKWESLVVIEQFGKLSQGNPLALKLFLQAFCEQEYDIHEFLASLFSGSSINIDENWLHRTPGIRSISDVRRLLEYEKEDSTLIYALLPFWEFICLQTLQDYFSYISYDRKTGRDEKEKSPITLKLRENLMMAELLDGHTNEEMKLLFNENELLTPFESIDLKALLQPLVDELFSDVKEEKQADEMVKYYTLHPIIPLVIRDRSTEGLPHARRINQSVIPRLFRYRTKKWPTGDFYFKPKWEVPRAIVKLEFYNFLGAAHCTLSCKPSVFTNLLLITIIGIVGKGIIGDRGRHALYATFLKAALKQSEAENFRLREVAAARPRIIPVNDWLLRLFSLLGDVRYLVDTTAEQLYHMPAVWNDVAAILFLMGLCDYYTRNDEAKVKEYLDQMAKIWEKRTRVPQIDGQLKALLDLPLKLMVASGGNANPLDNFSAEQMQLKADMRAKMYKRFESQDRDISGYDQGQGKSGLGMFGLGNAFSSQDEEVFIAILEAKRLMEDKPGPNYVEETRLLLQEALITERGLSPKPVNLAAIHRALSEEVEEKAGNWRRALYHWNEALRIETDAGYPKLGAVIEREKQNTKRLRDKVANTDITIN